MNPDIQAKWVAALRSGKYNQCRGQLRKGDCFCAIGVLCDVIEPDGWKRGYNGWEHDGQRTRLSIEFSRRLGFEPQFGFNGYHPQLAGIGTFICKLNDDLGYSFAEIADLIEARGVQ